MKAYIKKIEYYLPERLEENPMGSLRKKTGIERRHICSENEIASDLAVKAAEKLFANGVDKKSIEYLILCTLSSTNNSYIFMLKILRPQQYWFPLSNVPCH